MCIIAIAHRYSPRYPLIVAANRDERHARPSLPAAWWDGPGSVLAGRDLVAGGSWLGVNGSGRIAAVTNIFEAGTAARPRSRGALVSGFLESSAAPADYAAAAAANGASYGPFNLVIRDGDALAFASNRAPPAALAAGVHVFSNNAPGMRWAKVDSLAQVLTEAGEGDELPEHLIAALSGPGARGPREAASDFPFVIGDSFGTRCTTIVTIDRDGMLRFIEQSFAADGSPTGRVAFEFRLIR